MNVNILTTILPKTKRIVYFLLLALSLVGCTKTEFRKVDDPAYIRVFNNLTYTLSLANKEEAQPFFCMFIDPEFDASGKPIGGLVVGDFLDKRNIYAAPNAAHAGLSTSKFNPEYPGKELVPTGPILNGFDLTNWAQVPAGKRRFLFMSRPISDIAFSKLPDEQQRKVFLDTIIDLSSQEVYTLHILQRDFNTKENGLYVRQETFQKQSFSDTLSYVNFYNLSSKGFSDAPSALKNSVPQTSIQFKNGVRDSMNIFMTHIEPNTDNKGITTHTRIPAFSYQFAGTVIRNTKDAKVTPYYSFPIFPKANNKIYSNTWQFLQFAALGIDPKNSTQYPEPPTEGKGLPDFNRTFAWLKMDNGQYAPAEPRNSFFPGLTINVHSGIYNPKTFGVVNSIEIVNGNVFLMTVQRKYPQPIY